MSSLLRTRVFILVVLVSALYGACYPLLLFASQSADRPVEEDNIREAIFRYRMVGTKSKGPFFLSIEGKDPSDSFMARFANSKATIKKHSESYFKKDPFPGWLRDRSTNEQGTAFSVGPIKWLSATRVEVRGGMYCGGLCADGGIYRLEKKQRRWVVSDYEVQMVS